MKKVILAFAMLISLTSNAQDSVKITLGVQTRDVEYIASLVKINVEDIYDSAKVYWRGVENPPTGNTVINITSYTIDWYNVIAVLRYDPIAIVNNCTSRIETLLRALNQPYLTAKLDALEAVLQQRFSDIRQLGRKLYKKSVN